MEEEIKYSDYSAKYHAWCDSDGCRTSTKNKYRAKRTAPTRRYVADNVKNGNFCGYCGYAVFMEKKIIL